MSALGPEDIDAFINRWGDAIRAADERASLQEANPKKFDMWVRSVNHEMLVGPGIRALQRIIELQSDALREMMAEQEARNMSSMDASADPMRG